MRKVKIFGMAVLVILMFASFAGAQYPNILTGMLYSEQEFAKINSAMLHLDVAGVKVIVKNGKLTLIVPAGTVTYTKTKTIKK